MQYFIANKKKVNGMWERGILTFRNRHYTCLCFSRNIPFIASKLHGEEYEDPGRSLLKVKQRL